MHQRGFPMNQKSGRAHVTLSFTEAPLMRLSVDSLRQVVKRDLPIEFVPQQLTSYGGLELLHRYVRRLGLYPRLRRACADLGGDYCGARLSLLLLALFYVGARRVEHLKYLAGDPLVRRFSGLARLPTARTVTNWLRRFTHATLRPLVQLNQDLVLDALARLDVPRLTLDVDGTVVGTGATVAWAFRGFNPHHRKDLSYYPLRDVLSWLRRQPRRGERRQHGCSRGLGRGRRWSLARGGRGRRAVLPSPAFRASRRPFDGQSRLPGLHWAGRPAPVRRRSSGSPATASGPMSCGCS